MSLELESRGAMLKEDMVRQGDWLFRWRGYLPLAIVPVVLYEFRHYRFPMNSEFWAGVLEIVCLAVSLSGLAIRALTVGHAPAGTSGRITKNQKASQLNTTGMYSLCRNPLYLGNFVMVSGLLLFLQSPLTLALLAMFFWIYYERIILREEEFLREKFGDEYLRWTERTPVIFPRFSNWEKTSFPFSARTVLRREYSGFFCVIAVMTLFQAIGDWTVKKEFVIDTGWAVIFSLSLIVYLTLRTLKKKTRILHAPGR